MKSFDIKKIIEKLTTFKRMEFRSVSAKAHFDWKVILITFFLIWVGIVFLSINLFFQIDSGQLFRSNVAQPEIKSIIDKKTLDSVVRVFEARSSRAELLKTTKTNIADPSL